MFTHILLRNMIAILCDNDKTYALITIPKAISINDSIFIIQSYILGYNTIILTLIYEVWNKKFFIPGL